MSDTVHIRFAGPADALLVFGLVKELAAYERLSDEIDATEESLAAALFCEKPRVYCEIAEYQGEAIGFAVWFYSFSTFRGRHGIWLEDLYVKPQFRGRGFGKALIANIAQRCAREKLARLEWSVLDWNEPSIQFYKALDARMMDQWTNCRLEGAALSQLASSVRGP